MPGNTIKINNREELSWYLGDSKIDALIEWLDDEGIKEPEKDVDPNINEFYFPTSDESDSSEASEMKTKMDRLDGWLKTLIFPGKISNFIQEVGVEESPYHEIKRKFHFYTNEYKYTIVAIDRENNKGYLGCTVSSRKQLAGENWFRGNDLPDGPFNKETWDCILNGIIRYEIGKLSNHKPLDQKILVRR
jgi:hypothetical protein